VSDEQQIWARQPGEPLTWYRRFERYRLMVPVRSIVAVFREEKGRNERDEAPGRWYEEAKKWRWDERVAAWDVYLDGQIEQQIAVERKRVLRSRYALAHKRIEELDRLAQKLIDYAKDEKNIWLLDVKAIGTGPDVERVDLVQFNDALFREIRAHFADIAAELGERVKKKDVTVTELPANIYLGFDPDQDGVDK
jgi:hypothetical protein